MGWATLATDAAAELDGAAAVRIQVFGGLRLWHGDAEVNVGPPHQQHVLALLLLRRGGVASVSSLVDDLWGHDPADTAINQLQRHIGRLRRLLEPDLAVREPGRRLLAVPGGYRLDLTGIDCDLVTFDMACAQSRSARSAEEAWADARNALRTAVDRPFLGLETLLSGCEEYVSLTQQRTAFAVLAADVAIQVGAPESALDQVRRVSVDAPLDEQLQAGLIRLLAATGRRADALNVFDEVRHRLADELGIDAGVELRSAHLDILAANADLPATLSVSTAPTQPAPDPPSQLPTTVSGFTDRAELAGIFQHLQAEAASGASTVTVVSGMPGVGKTAQAVQWAHLLAEHFPDGQLYVNLRGFSSDAAAMQPADAITAMLTVLGDPPSGGTAGGDIEMLAVHWRSVLAKRRILLVLDNARNSAQVRPLLPGSGSCITIVTSRNQLPDLVVHEGARPCTLNPLETAEGRRMLSNRLGRQPVTQEAASVDELIRLCAGLPLALSIAAARAALNPRLSLADIAGEFGAMPRRLDVLSSAEGGHSGPDLRSVFAWSYAALTPDAARVFRLLGAHPGAQISLGAACSLAELDRLATRTLLRELASASLLTEPASDSYVFHDLVREYAEELLEADSERDEATARLLDHYVHSTRNAYLCFGRPPFTSLDPPRAGVTPDVIPAIAEAIAWYERERVTLSAVTRLAIARGEDLVAVLTGLDRRPMELHTPYGTDEVECAQLALLAATRLGDLRLVAEAERALFTHAMQAGQFDVAHAHATRARDLFSRAGDVAGQVDATRNIARLEWFMDQPARAVKTIESAVDLAEQSGLRHLVVTATILLVDLHLDQGNFGAAVDPAMRSLRVAQELGMGYDAQIANSALLDAYVGLGRFADAAAIARSLEDDSRALGDDYHVLFLPHAAAAYLGVGDRDRAREACARYLDARRALGVMQPRNYAQATPPRSLRRMAEVLAALQQDDDLSLGPRSSARG